MKTFAAVAVALSCSSMLAISAAPALADEPAEDAPTDMRSPVAVGGGILLGTGGLVLTGAGFSAIGDGVDRQGDWKTIDEVGGSILVLSGVAMVAGGTALVLWGAQSVDVPPVAGVKPTIAVSPSRVSVTWTF